MMSIPILRSKQFSRFPQLQFGMSTRQGGVSPAPLGMNLSYSVNDDEENVRRNRGLFFGEMNIRPDELAIPKQIHSGTVAIATHPGTYEACDALITNIPRLFVCVSVADCVPVFLFDPHRKIVAAIHAGWRGTAQRIVSNAVEMMNKNFHANASDIIAFVGPAAGECCYAVGDEVANQFAAEFVSSRSNQRFVHLKAANVVQLTAAGVPRASIEVSPLCTITEETLLHSYRRDKARSGRMMGAIGIIE